MFPKWLSIKISEDHTLDGVDHFKAVVAVDAETWAFRGPTFGDVYANATKSIEEFIKQKTGNGAA